MLTALSLVFSSTDYAIPAFARIYGTSCSTCHIDFPKLKEFGNAFKDAGFKFPKDDESMQIADRTKSVPHQYRRVRFGVGVLTVSNR